MKQQKMKTLAINLATRGRPALAQRTLEITRQNIKSNNTEGFLSIDTDDEDSRTFNWTDSYWILLEEDREDDLGTKYNRVLKMSDADIYMPLVDYTPHITPGFDLKILEAASRFPDGIGIVRNGYANLSFPKSQAVTRNLVAKLGWLWPPYFPYWFGDHWLDDIANMIGRYAYADFDIAILPREPKWFSSPQIATMEYREVDFWSSLFDLGYIERERQARQIIESPDFDEPQWKKELLIANFPLVRDHSRLINQAVRAQGQNAVPPSQPSERYARLKARAQQLALKWLAEIEETL